MPLFKELNNQPQIKWTSLVLQFPPLGQEPLLDQDLAKGDQLQRLASSKYHWLPKLSKIYQEWLRTILLPKWTKTQCLQFKICRPTLELWTKINNKFSTWELCRNNQVSLIRDQTKIKSNRIRTLRNTAKISRFQNFHLFYKSVYSVMRIWLMVKTYLRFKQANGSRQALEVTTSTKSRSSLMIFTKKRWSIGTIDNMSGKTFCSLNHQFSTWRNLGISGQKVTFWAKESIKNQSNSN